MRSAVEMIASGARLQFALNPRLFAAGVGAVFCNALVFNSERLAATPFDQRDDDSSENQAADNVENNVHKVEVGPDTLYFNRCCAVSSQPVTRKKAISRPNPTGNIADLSFSHDTATVGSSQKEDTTWLTTQQNKTTADGPQVCRSNSALRHLCHRRAVND